ncbi:hypothetical protein [Lysobacter sp. FW306-1B-D06B]|uniref:hypothetical protein n=1 Tax=Lysobacter sp. FW306-1B-D06B TaxID=3140250 RepID=UPI003140821C
MNWMAGLTLACQLGLSSAAPAPGEPASASAPALVSPPSNPYFITTPQLQNALTPLRHLPPDGEVVLHASVVTVPDPVETTMGKSFDMAVAAVLSAYQAKGYELDGFAFSWEPRKPDALPTAGVQGTASYDGKHRGMPSLLLFRKDGWREHGKPGAEAARGRELALGAADVAYDLVYLVGDSPSYGVQPRAFAVAAQCALLFNDVRATVSALSPAEPCNRRPSPGSKTLNVIGPSFSGSMQSLAVAIGRLGCGGETCDGSGRPGDLKVNLISPTASVSTNQWIAQHGFVHGIKVEYGSLAWTLDRQMQSLTRYLCDNDLLHERRIVFLAEESTFGRGARDLANRLDDDPPRCPGKGSLRFQVKPFSPNISSIRAEHSRLRKAELAARQQATGSSGRLLELDMASTEAGVDRPPPYQPALSSRSDELMLHRMFDSMRVWGKPDVVVIVATDVRDRLFLLSEVRKALPAALPVMLEMDYLMVHPDYRATSRGAVIVPALDPIVCLRDGEVDACARRRGSDRSNLKQRGEARDKAMRIPFSTDHAANMFRAVHLMVGYRERAAGYRDGGLSEYVMGAMCPGGPCDPKLYVATLAGFASLDEERRSTMVAADSRMALQRPWYLAMALLAIFLFAAGVWMVRGTPGGSVMSNFAGHLVTDSRWLTRWFLARDTTSSDRSRPAPVEDPEAVESLATLGRALLWGLTVIAGVVALVAVVRLGQIGRWGGLDASFDLAHGRDLWAVYCLWGLYACFAIVGVVRLSIAGRRYEVYGRSLDWPDAVQSRRPWLIPVGILLIVVFTFYFTDTRPVSVDARNPWLFAMLALLCSVAFLVTLASHLRQLGRVTLWLSRSIPSVQARKGMKDWPSPQALQETIQTPFNLELRRKDVAALKSRPLRAWILEGRLIIDGNGVYPPHASTFDAWQRQLVAELKLLVVAIRFSAWCALAAPLAVLLAMTAYPPIYERWLRTMSIGLLLASFAIIVVAVLRLEKDPMLGAMFTRHGDDLSFGGALRALWPKFLAMGAVLLPLVLPDVWTALHTLVRSINSLG